MYVVERLERRALLSVTATLINGELLVEGDSGPNGITVQLVTVTARVEVLERVGATNVRVADFPLSNITRVRVLSHAGDDAVAVRNVDRPITVDGGQGNDAVTVSGTTRPCELLGGTGDDVLRGPNSTGNRLLGEGGQDMLYGGTGRDLLDGGVGVRDEVYYDSRTAAVAVTLGVDPDGVAGAPPGNDGQSGEQDHVINVEDCFGGAGGDTLTGSAADNQLHGNGGNDKLDGAAGHDTLHGGAGGDMLLDTDSAGLDTAAYSDHAAPLTITLNGLADDGAANEKDNVKTDSVTGGDGPDRITGNGSPNRLRGGLGNDTLIGGDGNDTLDGGLGTDRLEGGGGTGDEADYANRREPLTIDLDENSAGDDGAAGENDTLLTIENVHGGAAADTITGNRFDNRLRGGDGADTLAGGDGDDTLDGGFGPDVFIGGAGARDKADYSTRTAGVAVTLGNAANDGDPEAAGGAGERDDVRGDVEDVTGGRGNDTLVGSSAANVLRGGPGNDTLDGGLGADSMFGDDGVDAATYATRTAAVRVDLDDSADDGQSGERDNVRSDVENVVGGRAGDTLIGSSKDNVLAGGDGNDSLQGGGGDDTLDGGSGADSMAGGTGSDTATYATRTAAVRVDLDGVADDGAANEKDNARSDMENIVGGHAADVLTGNSASNALTGGGGNDTLVGLAGRDALSGGGGDDTLDGGDGNDALAGGDGDGDTADYSKRTAGVVVTLNGENDRPGAPDDGARGTSENDFIRDDVENAAGGAGADTLTGNDGDNVLRGNGGDDTLSGGKGDDMLTGADGNDTLLGGDDLDTLDGGRGADVINGGGRTDLVTYEARTANLNVTLGSSADHQANDGEANERDDVFDVERLIGGSGHDTLVGNHQFNVLEGRRGNDLLVGNRGDDYLLGGPGADVMRGGDESGESPFVLDLADYSDRTNPVTVTLDGVANDGEPGEGDMVEDGVQDMRGGAGADRLVGNNGPNRLLGLGGNDTLVGNGGDDTLQGGAGTDTLQGGPGDDEADYLDHAADQPVRVTLDGVNNDGHAGENDRLGTEMESIRGGAGDDTLVGNSAANRIEGAGGDDTIDGGLGADKLYGGYFDVHNGVNQFLDDGVDTVDYSKRTARVVVDLGDALANDGQAGENDRLTHDSGIENVLGGAAGDAITGSPAANVLRGNGGNDTLDGAGGDDVLRGGTGADTLIGGAGAGDTADYADHTAGVIIDLDGNADDGSTGEGDRIGTDVENLIGGRGNDSLTGGAGANVLDGGKGKDSIKGGGGSDTVQYMSDRSPTARFTIKIGVPNASGETGEADSIDFDVERALGGPNDDTLQVGASTPPSNPASFAGRQYVLEGRGGGDTLTAKNVPARVTLDGGEGNDQFLDSVGVLVAGVAFPLVMLGGPGEDYLEAQFAAGAGANGPRVATQLSGGAGDDVMISSLGKDDFSGGDGTDAVRYDSVATGFNHAVGVTVRLTDGSAADPNDGQPGEGDFVRLDVETLVGTAAADTLHGTDRPVTETLDGGDGDDELFGLAGDDVLIGGRGNDFIFGGAGDDLLFNRATDPDADEVLGGDGDDAYQGDSRDTIDAQTLRETNFDPEPLAALFAPPDAAPVVGEGAGGDDDDVWAGLPASVTQSGNEILVTGTGAADLISARQVGIAVFVTVNAVESGPFNTNPTTILRVRALGGVDDISLRAGLPDAVRIGSKIDPGPGDDRVTGGNGNDYLFGGAAPDGNDYFDAGPGIDRADYSGRSGNLHVNTNTDNDPVANDGEVDRGERDQMLSNVEVVTAGAGSDTLTGGPGGDLLSGGPGDDHLSGNAGPDYLVGGSGVDVAFAGEGADAVILQDTEADSYRLGLLRPPPPPRGDRLQADGRDRAV